MKTSLLEEEAPLVCQHIPMAAAFCRNALAISYKSARTRMIKPLLIVSESDCSISYLKLDSFLVKPLLVRKAVFLLKVI